MRSFNAIRVLVVGLISLISSIAFAGGVCPKDQTLNEIKSGLLNKSISPDAKGTCVFLIPDPAKGKGKYAKVPVGDIAYRECAERGDEAVAFKWFSPEVMTFEQVSEKLTFLCGGACEGFPPTCPGVCYCVGATHCE